jgi:hypothetical protein
MSKLLAQQFLTTEIGKQWLETKDYKALYGALGRFCSLHTSSYEIPQPAPIVEEIKAILSQASDSQT